MTTTTRSPGRTTVGTGWIASGDARLDDFRALVEQETDAAAVKLEGGVTMAPTIRALVERGIPVMGHIGLTPQSVHALGGYRVQGREEAAAMRLLADAHAVEEAGAFSVVLELVPASLAARVTTAAGTAVRTTSGRPMTSKA